MHAPISTSNPKTRIRGGKISKNPAVEALIQFKRNTPSVRARDALDQLFRRALGLPQGNDYYPAPAYEPVEGGDPVAIEEYAKIVSEHVTKLNSLIATHREMLLPISRNCFSWPMQISKRKVFGDDPDKLIEELKVGYDTIAGCSAARFDPTKKFGKVAWNLIKRIECWRALPTQWWEAQQTFSHAPYCNPYCISHCSWATQARKLPAFTTKPSAEEKKQWLDVVNQALEDDLLNSERHKNYRSLITAPSHQDRWKAVFFDKVRGEIEILWAMR